MKLTVRVITIVAIKLLDNIVLTVSFVDNHIQDTLHLVEGLYVLSAQCAFRSCVQIDVGVAERVAAVVALLPDVNIYEVFPSLFVVGGNSPMKMLSDSPLLERSVEK